MPAWDDWVRVCYHEAGHAAVALALGCAASPIALRCPIVQGQLQAQGTYKLPTNLPLGSPPEVVLLLIKRLAAGGVAEEIQFGNHSYGVTGDHSKINQILLVSGQPAICVQEQQGNYPTTRNLLHAIWPAVARIAEITLRRFRSMQLPDVEFQDIQVLTTNAVNRIFSNPLLTEQEHVAAQLKALLYARCRGKGADPEFQRHLAIQDFEKAAGDVLGELQ